MSKYKVDIGTMNKRIMIQKYTTGTNDNGFPIDEWNDYKPVWASMTSLSGREYYAAAAVNAEQTIKVKTRYIKYLDATINDEGIKTTEKFRIKYKKSIFDIKFINDVMFLHQFMEFKLLVVG